ncbi:MAG: transposase, partial [Sedimentisphaerales bacterium]|nr:transposase [Sedimentisphaerales bacterium]
MKDIFYNPDGDKKVTQRNLPHWQQKGKMYFITFRLADSIPAEKLLKLQKRQQEFERMYQPPYTPKQQRLYQRLFFEQVESWLDNCFGSCILEQSQYSQIVMQALEYFDGQKYRLDHWVIMPNHVHVLLLLKDGTDIKNILHSWKSYTAHEINKLSGKDGPVWQHESFDHIVRSEFYLNKYREYINNNKERIGRNVSSS